MITIPDSPREQSSSVPLMVVENGCGSPCIDLRQVSSELAAAAKDADLVTFCLRQKLVFTRCTLQYKCILNGISCSTESISWFTEMY